MTVFRIGRITKGLLLNVAQEVDIVEPIAKFTDQLRGYPGIGSVFNVGLEKWYPEGVQYDLVWTQWCLGHLSDDQVVGYLERCKGVLTPAGVIVVKENLSTGDEDLFDETDSSVTRLVLFLFARLLFHCIFFYSWSFSEMRNNALIGTVTFAIFLLNRN